MTAELLVSILAVVMSLLFAYLPGLKGKYETLSSEYKALVQGLGLVVISAAVFGLGCAGLAGDFQLNVTCDKSGAIGLVSVLVSALIANQATYMVAVRPFKS